MSGPLDLHGVLSDDHVTASPAARRRGAGTVVHIVAWRHGRVDRDESRPQLLCIDPYGVIRWEESEWVVVNWQGWVR